MLTLHEGNDPDHSTDGGNTTYDAPDSCADLLVPCSV
jgi:hypothetical protein